MKEKRTTTITTEEVMSGGKIKLGETYKQTINITQAYAYILLFLFGYVQHNKKVHKRYAPASKISTRVDSPLSEAQKY